MAAITATPSAIPRNHVSASVGRCPATRIDPTKATATMPSSTANEIVAISTASAARATAGERNANSAGPMAIRFLGWGSIAAG
ncbi:MAG: hypothetical protein ACXWH5_05665 [Actinomycetota bacterium]